MISKVTAQLDSVVLKPILLKDVPKVAELYTEDTIRSSKAISTKSKLRAALHTLFCLITHNYHYAAYADDNMIGVVDVNHSRNGCNKLSLIFKTKCLSMDSAIYSIVDVACTTVRLYSSSPIVCSIPLRSKLNIALLRCGFNVCSNISDSIAYIMPTA